MTYDCSVSFFKEGIAKGCLFKNKSSIAIFLIIIWILASIGIFTFDVLHPNVVLLTIVVMIIGSEGFFSTAYILLNWGKDLGNVIYEVSLKFIGDNFKSLNRLEDKLKEELSANRPALNTSYNHFLPFKGLKKETEKTAFYEMCKKLSDVCNNNRSSLNLEG